MAKGANIICNRANILNVYEASKIDGAGVDHDLLSNIQKCTDVDQLGFDSMSLNDDVDITSRCQPHHRDSNDSMDTMESNTAASAAATSATTTTTTTTTDELRHGFHTNPNRRIPAMESHCTVSRRREVSIDEGYSSKSMDGYNCSGQELHHGYMTVQTTPQVDYREVFSQDSDGDTDLHIAIIQRQNPLAMLFISAAPNCEFLDIVNRLLQTPLHLAVITGQDNIVRRLMIGGARVDSRDIHGNTPLHIACREGFEDIAQCLLRPLYYEETLTNTYEIPYQRIPQNLNLRNYEGHTCLHLAAMSTYVKVLDVLLNKGADVNIGDGRSGRTILHYASETGNRILLQYLLSQRSVDISCATFGGMTPLRLAAGRGYGDVVNVLVANGADVRDCSDDESIDDYHVNGNPITV